MFSGCACFLLQGPMQPLGSSGIPHVAFLAQSFSSPLFSGDQINQQHLPPLKASPSSCVLCLLALAFVWVFKLFLEK